MTFDFSHNLFLLKDLSSKYEEKCQLYDVITENNKSKIKGVIIIFKDIIRIPLKINEKKS